MLAFGSTINRAFPDTKATRRTRKEKIMSTPRLTILKRTTFISLGSHPVSFVQDRLFRAVVAFQCMHEPTRGDQPVSQQYPPTLPAIPLAILNTNRVTYLYDEHATNKLVQNMYAPVKGVWGYDRNGERGNDARERNSGEWVEGSRGRWGRSRRCLRR